MINERRTEFIPFQAQRSFPSNDTQSPESDAIAKSRRNDQPRGMNEVNSVLLLATLLLVAGTVSADDPEGISADKLRTHCNFLASDTLEGREAGTTGGRAAAAYLRQQFQEIGLAPAAGDGDYFQEFGRGYRNIIGLLPGEDPELSNEYVILGAHYDHVGYARRGNAYGPIGQIHNGADDNASGTAAVLEVARVLGALERPLSRSILFVLWDAEEIGLDGSQHWLRAPTVQRDRVRLSINVDMVGRLREETVNVRGVRTMHGLRRLLTGANLESDLVLAYDWGHKRDSDHYPFYQARIPYLSFDTGKHADYHRPSDDPHRLNIDGLERVGELLLRTVTAAAAQHTLTPFRSESVHEALRSDDFLVSTPPVFPIRLGFGWHVRPELSEPIRVRVVDPGSPAEAAGVRVGDVVLSLNGRETAGRDDIRLQVSMTEGPIEIVVERDGAGEPLVLSAGLDGAPLPWGILTREDAAESELPVVIGLMSGSPADSAGVERGDRLIRSPPEDLPAGGPPDTTYDPSGFESGPGVIVVERGGRIERLRIDSD